MTKRQVKHIFMDYVKGNISTNDFWEMYKNNEEIRNVLINDKKRKRGIIKTKETIIRFNDKDDAINPDNLLDVLDISRLEHRYSLFLIINRFLLMRGIDITEIALNADAQEVWFLEEMLPDYLYPSELSFLESIFASAPNGYTKTEKLSWCKNKIKEMFQFDSVEPDWYQFPEWPWSNGTPMVFKYQETTEEGIVNYYFYDKKTNEVKVIEQVE